MREDATERAEAAQSESPESAVPPRESTDSEPRTEKLQSADAELQTERRSDAPVPATMLDQVKGLVLNSVSQNHSRRAYERAIEDFMAWYEARPGRPPLSNRSDSLSRFCVWLLPEPHHPKAAQRDGWQVSFYPECQGGTLVLQSNDATTMANKGQLT
ncbi:MAG: hypothetical protein ACLQOO_02935 [Terriglobia bacterium]